MDATHKIFFAIPFDRATKAMYERVVAAVRKKFPTITAVIGIDEVGPSPRYADIMTFRAQNRQLMGQFVAQIRDADVIVADLSHNNPNVHVELGIALTENKNVLRVTGRPHTELGFDIRGLDVYAYSDEKDLRRKVVAYLEMFFAIKRLSLSPDHGDLYYRLPAGLDLNAYEAQFVAQFPMPPNYVMRDGIVRATFEIVRTKSDNDWCGIYLRTGADVLRGSHLVYVRQSGKVEVGVYPGPRIFEHFQLPKAVTGQQTITIEFENNKLSIHIGSARFESARLWHQAVGRIAFAAWQADVKLHAAEAVSRDTIEWGEDAPW